MKLEVEEPYLMKCPKVELIYVWGKKTDINEKEGHCRSQWEALQTLGFTRSWLQEIKVVELGRGLGAGE